jgi:hypothetical protein
MAAERDKAAVHFMKPTDTSGCISRNRAYFRIFQEQLFQLRFFSFFQDV